MPDPEVEYVKGTITSKDGDKVTVDTEEGKVNKSVFTVFFLAISLTDSPNLSFCKVKDHNLYSDTFHLNTAFRLLVINAIQRWKGHMYYGTWGLSIHRLFRHVHCHF